MQHDRLSHHLLLAFLLLHLVSSSALFILSTLSLETNASASHLLRHIVNNANLSSTLFVDPTTGRMGDWRTAPALVLDGSDLNVTMGVICDDQGKKCRGVSDGSGDGKGTSSSGDGNGVSSSSGMTTAKSSTTLIPDTTLAPNVDPSTTTPPPKTSTTVLVISGTVLTTEVLLVPTITVVNGEALHTDVLLTASASPAHTKTNTNASVSVPQITGNSSSTANPAATAASSSSTHTGTRTSTSAVSSIATATVLQVSSPAQSVTTSEPVSSGGAGGANGNGIGNGSSQSPSPGHGDDIDDDDDDDDDEDADGKDDEEHEAREAHDDRRDHHKRHPLHKTHGRKASIQSQSLQLGRRGVSLSIVEAKGVIVGVEVSGLSGNGDGDGNSGFVSESCAVSFGWPINSLDNLVREEIVLASLFLWLLGLAIVALVTESTPHLVALFLSLLFTTAWTAYDLTLSFAFYRTFQSTIVDQNCGGVTVLPHLLAQRLGIQSTVLAVSMLTLGGSGLLCWKMRDHFGWQTFQRIGASAKINRLYKLVLAISILLQLDIFVLVTFFALFLDQISRGQTSYYMVDCKAFQGVYITLICGWTSIREEPRGQFNLFLFLSVLLVAAWAALFANPLFRLIFSTWTFFEALGSLGLILTVLTIALSVLRRVTFGKGLADYLYVEEMEERGLSASESGVGAGFHGTTQGGKGGAERGDEKKLPTFSAAFGPGPAQPPQLRRLELPARVASWLPGDDRRSLPRGPRDT